MNYFPPTAFSFCVRISDNPADEGSGFQAVTGLDTERGVTEVVEGGENRFIHTLPDTTTPQHLVLERGQVLRDSPLFTGCTETVAPDLTKPITPISLTVALLDQEQAPVMAWSVSGAWAVSWTVGDLGSDKRDVAIELLELAYTSLSGKVHSVQRSDGAAGL